MLVQGGVEKHPKIIENLYGLRGMEQYANVIAQTVLSTPHGNAVVLVGHNGPAGLGNAPVASVDALNM